MQFDSLAEFLAMGGHGLYVWLAYGAVALFLVGYTSVIKFRRKQIMAELRFQIQAAKEMDTASGKADARGVKVVKTRTEP